MQLHSITYLPICSPDDVDNDVLMFTVIAFCYVYNVYKIVVRFLENVHHRKFVLRIFLNCFPDSDRLLTFHALLL